MLAVWAETGLILSDEFRDGNVPAMMNPLTAAKAAFGALPPTVETFYYRGDSASHEHELMDWYCNPEREDGPKGYIEEWTAAKRIQGHREKAGTAEMVHDVLKNELAAGVLPCGRFGANAAWLRLAVITHNVLTALKRLALPKYLPARPKRLRFLFLNLAGRVSHHARTMRLRLATLFARIGDTVQAFEALPIRV